MKNNSTEPLLVQIPDSEHFIDVQPFINFIFADFDEPQHALKDCENDIDKRIRFIATDLTFLTDYQSDSIQLSSLFENLYRLKDLFSATSILTKKRT